MNYKKGFFRITIILSTISEIFGLIIGINQFSLVYKNYNARLQSYKSYHEDMHNILDNSKNDVSANDKINKTLADEVMRSIDLTIDDNAKKFKIKKELIGKIDLDGIVNNDFITIKEIIDNGINKRMDEFTKNKIADEYATANVDTSFPWGEGLIYILLIPLLFGGIIWIIYYIAKYIAVGFRN